MLNLCVSRIQIRLNFAFMNEVWDRLYPRALASSASAAASIEMRGVAQQVTVACRRRRANGGMVTERLQSTADRTGGNHRPRGMPARMTMQPTTPDAHLKPPILAAGLRNGDRVRLVSPASWFDPNKVQTGDGCRYESSAVEPQLASHALARYGQYSAGTSAQRLEDLHAAFADSSVNAIICNRGGYGSAELLEGLDLDLIRRNPKIFMGCSDITAC